MKALKCDFSLFFFTLALWTQYVYNIDMTIKVNTATLKQKLSHYLALAREGKDVLVTNHRRIIARVLSEEGKDGRLPLRQPTKDASVLQDVGGFGCAVDPVADIISERGV
jgi:prevent-host-death family protein